ncbi:4261_t:CDS:2 [Funneliformis geosporum]|uniref:4261_t:CDS:1 n=1 Tax=Funneliformis geosporum TaxID=1117311 RepID=A0A9W4T4A8_9GLOM|nr:4261_t:CDS:2 [Funneliformis geosporum]
MTVRMKINRIFCLVILYIQTVSTINLENANEDISPQSKHNSQEKRETNSNPLYTVPLQTNPLRKRTIKENDHSNKRENEQDKRFIRNVKSLQTYPLRKRTVNEHDHS